MSENLIIAIINLVAKLGLSAAIDVLTGLKTSKTIDDAIAALDASSKKSWQDYKDEAKPKVP